MTENYSAIKVEVLIQPAMWINLVSMLSGKKNQIQQVTYYIVQSRQIHRNFIISYIMNDV